MGTFIRQLFAYAVVWATGTQRVSRGVYIAFPMLPCCLFRKQDVLFPITGEAPPFPQTDDQTSVKH